jgi:hypothetical protein
MKFEIYQYIVPVISLLFLVRISIQLKNKRRSIFSSIVWSIFWIVVGVLALAPHLLSTFLADVLGFRDNVHAVLFIGLGLALLIIFYLSSVIDKLETQLTNLVRTLALHDSEHQEREIEEANELKKVKN